MRHISLFFYLSLFLSYFSEARDDKTRCDDYTAQILFLIDGSDEYNAFFTANGERFFSRVIDSLNAKFKNDVEFGLVTVDDYKHLMDLRRDRNATPDSCYTLHQKLTRDKALFLETFRTIRPTLSFASRTPSISTAMVLALQSPLVGWKCGISNTLKPIRKIMIILTDNFTHNYPVYAEDRSMQYTGKDSCENDPPTKHGLSYVLKKNEVMVIVLIRGTDFNRWYNFMPDLGIKYYLFLIRKHTTFLQEAHYIETTISEFCTIRYPNIGESVRAADSEAKRFDERSRHIDVLFDQNFVPLTTTLASYLTLVRTDLVESETKPDEQDDTEKTS